MCRLFRLKSFTINDIRHIKPNCLEDTCFHSSLYRYLFVIYFVWSIIIFIRCEVFISHQLCDSIKIISKFVAVVDLLAILHMTATYWYRMHLYLIIWRRTVPWDKYSCCLFFSIIYFKIFLNTLRPLRLRRLNNLIRSEYSKEY